MAIIELTDDESIIENLGMFTCTPTASVPVRFRIRGLVVDRGLSIEKPVAAKPVRALLLRMSPETALGLAVEILRAAQRAKVPLPEGVELRSATP